VACSLMSSKNEYLVRVQHSDILYKLWINQGNYCRHPDPSKWYSKSDVMSRDQATPNVIAMGLTNNRKLLLDFFKGHLKRGLLFMTNTRHNEPSNTKAKLPDVTGPEFWGYYIRGFKLWFLWPILLIFDLETLITSLTKLFKKNDLDDA